MLMKTTEARVRHRKSFCQLSVSTSTMMVVKMKLRMTRTKETIKRGCVLNLQVWVQLNGKKPVHRFPKIRA